MIGFFSWEGMFLRRHQGQLQKVLEDIKCLGVFWRAVFLKAQSIHEPRGVTVGLMHSWADT